MGNKRLQIVSLLEKNTLVQDKNTVVKAAVFFHSYTVTQSHSHTVTQSHSHTVTQSHSHTVT